MILVKLWLVGMLIWLLLEGVVGVGTEATVVKLVVFLLVGGWMVRGEMKRRGWVKGKEKDS